MNRISVGGVRLELAHIPPPIPAPSQEPIIYLHEGLGCVSLWRDWPAGLCQRAGRAGWIYSRRGYGQSDPVPQVRAEPGMHDGQRIGRLLPDYLHHEAWDVLPELLRRLEVRRPVLVGHSDGGSIALLYASRFPVAACIVLAPHLVVEPIAIESVAQARQAYEGGDLRRRLARHHADVDSAFWQWNDIWLSEAFRSFDIRQECRHVTAPVLAIQGHEDPYGTLDQIAQIDLPTERIRRVALDNCGHAPHRDHPEECQQLIAEFLAEVA